MFAATSMKATGALAILSCVLAVAMIWTLMTDPVAVATAVNNSDLPAAICLLARAFVSAVEAIARYL